LKINLNELTVKVLIIVNELVIVNNVQTVVGS